MNRECKKSNYDRRYLVTRLALHGLHHTIFQSKGYHLVEENSHCKVCKLECAGYRTTDCKLETRSSSIFWDLTPCSPLKVNRRFGGTFRFHVQGRRISQVRNQREAGSKHSSALKKKICSSETSVDFQQTTRFYISDDRTLHNHRRENLKFYKGLNH
jgi:hypothetical protein